MFSTLNLLHPHTFKLLPSPTSAHHLLLRRASTLRLILLNPHSLGAFLRRIAHHIACRCSPVSYQSGLPRLVKVPFVVSPKPCVTPVTASPSPLPAPETTLPVVSVTPVTPLPIVFDAAPSVLPARVRLKRGTVGEKCAYQDRLLRCRRSLEIVSQYVHDLMEYRSAGGREAYPSALVGCSGRS